MYHSGNVILCISHVSKPYWLWATKPCRCLLVSILSTLEMVIYVCFCPGKMLPHSTRDGITIPNHAWEECTLKAHWKHLNATWIDHLLIKSVTLKDTHPHADEGGQGLWTFPRCIALSDSHYNKLKSCRWSNFFHPTLYKTQHLSSSDQIAEKELRAVFGMNHRCVCVCVWYFYLCTVVTDHII